MDFASIMKAQIAKSAKPKKGTSVPPPSPSTKDLSTGHPSPSSSSPSKTVPDTSISSTSSSSSSSSKYIRRGEVEARRLEAYHEEQAAAEAARLERQLKRQREDEEERERAAVRAAKKVRLAEQSRLQREAEQRAEEAARRKRLGLPPLPEPGEEGGNDGGEDSASRSDDSDENEEGGAAEDIPDPELRAKLRDLSEPTVLFAESHAARLRRYRRLVSGSGSKQKKKAMSGGPIPTSIRLVPEDELPLVPTKPPHPPAERAALFRHLASYFALVFARWQVALAARPEEVRASSSGRQALAAFETARLAMGPLFRLFEKAETGARRKERRDRKTKATKKEGADENGQAAATSTKKNGISKGENGSKKDGDDDDDEGPIPAAVLDGIVEIVHAAQRRRYVDASDAYLRLSIGRAAWPIGVTMVGIHERSAREKLHEGDGARKAHIMSDELTRKYLQAIKSCLAFAQTRWPPEDHLQLMG